MIKLLFIIAMLLPYPALASLAACDIITSAAASVMETRQGGMPLATIRLIISKQRQTKALRVLYLTLIEDAYRYPVVENKQDVINAFSDKYSRACRVAYL